MSVGGGKICMERTHEKNRRRKTFAASFPELTQDSSIVYSIFQSDLVYSWPMNPERNHAIDVQCWLPGL